VAAVALAAFAWGACGASAGPMKLPDLVARQVFQHLHGRIYAAFDARCENDIYDTLASGLTGPILDDVYNEVYQAMLARDAGLVNFRIRRIKPIETVVLPAEPGDAAGAFRVRYHWRVYGTVTHVGHTHARFNEYEAEYLVRPTAGGWRLAGSKVWQNKRVKIGQ